MLDVAREVFDYTQDKPRDFERWWRNNNVDKAACNKRVMILNNRPEKRGCVRSKEMARAN